MKFTIRGIANLSRNPHFLLTVALLVAMTLLGPFGTYNDFHFWKRLGYWTAAIGGVGAVATLIGFWTRRFGRQQGLHPLLIAVLSAAITAVPGTLIVWQVEVIWRGEPYGGIDLSQVGQGVFVIVLIATIVRFGAWRSLVPNRTVAMPSPAAPDRGNAPFFDRLPPEVRGRLITLSMQDHYVECVTTRGRALVLMRFADALKELQGYPGLRIHRSHWVADGVLRGVSRKGSRYIATLSDARQLPVSRTYLDAVRNAVASNAGTANAAE